MPHTNISVDPKEFTINGYKRKDDWQRLCYRNREHKLFKKKPIIIKLATAN